MNHTGYVIDLVQAPLANPHFLPSTASHTFTGLEMDREYTVVVYAEHLGLEGTAAEATVRTSCRAEALPTALRAESGYLGTAAYIDVYMSRTASPIEPEGFVYEVERCQGTASTCAGGPWVRVGTVTELDRGESPDGVLELRLRDALGLLLDEHYAYRVRARRLGTSCPAPGDALSEVLEVISPPAPALLVNVFWNPLPGAPFGIEATWTNGFNDLGPLSALYRRRAGETFALVEGSETSAASGSFLDTSPLELDAVYEYAVGTFNAFTTLRQPDGSELTNPVFGQTRLAYSPPRPRR